MEKNERLALDIKKPPLETLLSQELFVDGFEASTVDIEFTTPMALPFGLIHTRPSGWVTLRSNDRGRANVGYGEGVTLPSPLFTDDYGGNITENTNTLLTHIIRSKPVTYGQAIHETEVYRFGDLGRYPTARLAVELALIDLLAKSNDLSVQQLIGLPDSITDVAYGKSIGATETASIIRQAEAAINDNATKIKLKITPQSFYEVTEAIVQLRAAAPVLEYMVDANGMFDPANDDDLDKIRALDSLNLAVIEEPVSRVGMIRGLDAVRLLRNRVPSLVTPLCLDDCLQTYEECKNAISEGLAEVVNIKPGRVGSFIKSLDLINWVSHQGGQVMVGGMFEATPGRCMTTILGAYCAYRGFTIPGDLSLAQERLKGDLVTSDKQLYINSAGNIQLPSGKGWGFS